MLKKRNSRKHTKKEAGIPSNRLQKLKRQDLLKIMYRQQKEIERLEEEVALLEEKLENRRLAIKDIGSIAEASLKLNGVFEAAEKAVQQYIENAEAEINTAKDQAIRSAVNVNNDEAE